MGDPKSPLPLPARLLTAEEVAEIMNVDIRTVRRRIKDKTLPIVRFGRLVRIRPEVLAALIKGE
jgi:excisionase family DNA binding protein